MRHRVAQKGLALVEMALVLPLFVMLCFGMIEWSLLLYDKAIITNASREAARAGVVYRIPKLTDAQIQAVALNYCQSYLISLGAKKSPTVSVDHTAKSGFSNPLGVTVTYAYTGLGLGALISTFSGSLNLSATSVMNNE